MILVRQLMTKERKVFDKKKKKRSIGKRGVVDKWLIDMNVIVSLDALTT